MSTPKTETIVKHGLGVLGDLAEHAQEIRDRTHDEAAWEYDDRKAALRRAQSEAWAEVAKHLWAASEAQNRARQAASDLVYNLNPV